MPDRRARPLSRPGPGPTPAQERHRQGFMTQRRASSFHAHGPGPAVLTHCVRWACGWFPCEAERALWGHHGPTRCACWWWTVLVTSCGGCHISGETLLPPVWLAATSHWSWGFFLASYFPGEGSGCGTWVMPLPRRTGCWCGPLPGVCLCQPLPLVLCAPPVSSFTVGTGSSGRCAAGAL